MNSTGAPVLFYYCRERIDELLDANAGMTAVERAIDGYALDRDEKDALWLWARGQLDRLVSDGSRAQPAMPEGDGHD